MSQLDLGKQSLLLNVLPDGERTLPRCCLTSRIISTNTRDLAEEMRGGNFREELYFRLNGICLRIPSLRQRKEDIPPLFAAFLSKYADLLGRQQPSIKNSTMELLLQHTWPGNARELENVARKIVVLGDDELAIGDLAVDAQANDPAKASLNRCAYERTIAQASSTRGLAQGGTTIDSRISRAHPLESEAQRTGTTDKLQGLTLQIEAIGVG